MPTSAPDPGPLVLEVLAEALSVCRLSADAPVPTWAHAAAASFCSITRTADECSIICPTASVVPSSALVHEAGWRALKLVGPFPFTVVGVLLRVAAPLAAAGISILPIATYNTDYVLVREAQLRSARVTLQEAGHRVRDTTT